MARRRPTEPTPSVNPARGAALVVVAVLVGLFLLRNGLDTSEVVTASDDDSEADGGAADEGTDDATDEGTETTNTALPPARTPDQVPTIVLNGSGVSGAAGRYSEFLGSRGYQLTDPDGANANANVPTTQILYAEGFEQEALELAEAIGAAAIAPAPLGAEPPGEIMGAMVVVVLGPDLAETDPAAPADAATDAGAEGETDAATGE